MKTQPLDTPRIAAAYDKSAIDPNTTLDIFIGPRNTVTELADTVETLDGVRAETIDIANEQDGTHLEVIVLEEQLADQPDKDQIDNFVTVDGIGPEVAALLLAGGIRTFRQLANTPIERIREILDAAGPRFRVHDAASWSAKASKLAHYEPFSQSDEAQLPYGLAHWPNQTTKGEPMA
ncbi:helix-hairpin-helix domain-containing protein [Fibrella aquatilis]|uniref:Helix-hairpin-helix domain-containing protein n=1 Tax=Fibrella aquatilis TaxID=2817059 RepID=A0A939G5X3_9BACT|nr:helix-hairpin-helix domain-containing protein [Fibrella aquatilis]MBO0931214.1 helix-hairpin-helix domain-containing protein [Fibrella aquatilis]